MNIFNRGMENFERLLMIVELIGNKPHFTILVFNDQREGFTIAKRYSIFTYSDRFGIKTFCESSPKIDKVLEYLTNVNKEENITKGIYGIGVIDESVLGTEMSVLFDAYDILETNNSRGVIKLCERTYTKCAEYIKGVQ